MNTKINTKNELIGLIHQNGGAICHFGVTKLGIFGSFVRDEVKPDSDVDFFIELNPEFKTLKNFVGLSNYLEQLTGRKIELVTPQSLNKFIGKYILQEIEYITIAV